MKVEELRIGNYVLARGAQSVVKSIYENHIGYSKSKRVEEKVPIKLIQPIPITEESLVKFGFEHIVDEDSYDYIHQFGNLEVNADWHDGKLIGVRVECIEHTIKYVHQLQNLYWCLCGKELEIIT